MLLVMAIMDDHFVLTLIAAIYLLIAYLALFLAVPRKDD